MLAGGILIGSVLAEIESADAPDLILHGIGVIAGAVLLWLGLELGRRQIRLTPDGISTRLLGERTIAWSAVREVRQGPFGTRMVVSRRGAPIVLWPFMEGFAALVAAIDTRPTERAGGTK